MFENRTVMAVHAHPDDETTKGGALLAWLAAQGARTVLVTCTDGSAGDVTDESLLDGRSLAQVRSEELAVASGIMGFEVVHELGYPDSGVDAEIEAGFANLAMTPMTDRLVALIDAEQPDVVIAYEPEYAKRHPDHLRCHDIAAAAFARTSPNTGGPRKFYGTRFHSLAHFTAMHEWMKAAGQKSPYEKALAELPEDRFTTRIAVGEHHLTARQALRAHRTQIAHDNRWFYSIPDDVIATLYPWEELALLTVAADVPARTGIESDLFTGI